MLSCSDASLQFEVETLQKKMLQEESNLSIEDGKSDKYLNIPVDESSDTMIEMHTADTYKNSRQKLRDSIKSLRSLSNSSPNGTGVNKTRTRPKLKLVDRRCPYKTLRLRSQLDSSPYQPPKIKVNKEDQIQCADESVSKRYSEVLADDRVVSCRHRRAAGGGGDGGGGGRARAASRRRVGSVLEPPTAADALRRRAWPTAGMHERPEWPRAAASRSPTPPPHDVAAAAADAARRSVHCSMHAALAFGAQACQDIKEELEAKSNKKTSSEKVPCFPHVFEQYLRICHQDGEYICKQKCESQSSEENSMHWDNASDKNSEPLDLSDGSAECDSYDFPDPPQSNTSLSEHSMNCPNVAHNFQSFASINPLKTQNVSALRSKTLFQPYEYYGNSKIRLTSNASHKLNELQQRPCGNKHFNDRNMFLVTGHFDTSNTFCITSSTKCDKLDDNTPAELLKHTTYNTTKSPVGTNLSVTKFSPAKPLFVDSAKYNAKYPELHPNYKHKESFISNAKHNNALQRDLNSNASNTLQRFTETKCLNNSLDIQEVKIKEEKCYANLSPHNQQSLGPSHNKHDFNAKMLSANSEVVIIPIPQENRTDKILGANNNEKFSSERKYDHPVIMQKIDSKSDKNINSILKLPTSDPNHLSTDASIPFKASEITRTEDKIECIKKRLVCTSSNLLTKEIDIFTQNSAAATTTCIPYFPKASQTADSGSRTQSVGSYNGINESKLLDTNILVEEGDKYLHVFRVNKVENSDSESTDKHSHLLPHKSPINILPRSKNTLIPRKMLPLLSSKEVNEKKMLMNANQFNKFRNESRSECSKDINGKKLKCSCVTSCCCYLQAFGKNSYYERNDNSSEIIHHSVYASNSHRKEETAIESLLPVIFHRALHYCMLCEVPPEELAAYIDTLSPPSIMNWPE